MADRYIIRFRNPAHFAILVWLIIATLQMSTICTAQPFYFRQYQVENGLSSNTVICSALDKKGFLWFGTKDGLNRFDGYQFRIFRPPGSGDSSFTKNYITSMTVDSAGVIWVGTEKGLYWFDEQNEKLVFLATPPGIGYTRAVFADHSGQIWFNRAGKVYRYHSTTKQLMELPADRYFSATAFAESNGFMWLGAPNGCLYRLNPETGTHLVYNIFSHSPKAKTTIINKILPDKNGHILIGTRSQGMKELDIETATYKDLMGYSEDKVPIFVRDILQVSADEFWFATGSGIYVYNRINPNIMNLRKKSQTAYSLSDNSVQTLCKDKEGGIWAGTFFGGICYYTNRSFSPFEKYFPDNSTNSISGNAVREICEDRQGNIWIGTEDAGLNKLDPVTGIFKPIKPADKAGSIASYNVHGLAIVGSNLWAGSFMQGLDILNTKTSKVIKHFYSVPREGPIKNSFVISLLCTKNGTVYAGTENGLYKYSPQKDDFIFQSWAPQYSGVPSLAEDHAGVIWAGTYDEGVFCFNPLTGRTRNFRRRPGDENSLGENMVNSITEDSSHILWFATEGGGLSALNAERDKFTRYTTRDGLPSNFIFKTVEDNRRHLWITTSNGLAELHPDRGSFTLYTKSNGLLTDQFNYNSGYKDKNGKLYFGSVKGMIAFNPEGFQQNQFAPPVYITGFQAANRELQIGGGSGTLRRSILYTGKIVLPYDKSTFSIDFAALSFLSPEMTRYRYILEGAEKDWTLLSTNRRVYFTDLNPGSYTFRVRACSKDFMGEPEKRLVITIRPPFYNTKLAWLLYILSGCVLLYYIMNTYFNKLRFQKEKEIYNAKIEFFTNIAHDIKTPLTLIKGPVDNLHDMIPDFPEIKKDVDRMERNTNRLVDLVNQLMDFRQTEEKMFSLNFHEINISKIIADTFNNFKMLADKKKLEYTLDLPVHSIHILADEDALLKIFGNLFSNAIKYASREVIIELVLPRQQDRNLIIRFYNDGFVIPAAMKEKIFEPFFRMHESNKQRGTGIGLAIARSLAELHKGRLFVENPGTGNVFVLELPFGANQ